MIQHHLRMVRYSHPHADHHGQASQNISTTPLGRAAGPVHQWSNGADGKNRITVDQENKTRRITIVMRSPLFAVLLSAAVPLAALAQTANDLKNDENTPGDVLVYGMGYSANRFSPLAQINKDNVSKLVPVWAYSLADLQGGESFPLVKDGVIYATTHNATVAESFRR